MNQQDERFPPTGGRILGGLGIAGAALVIAISVADGWHGLDVPVVAGAVCFGVMVWAALLRPAVRTSGPDLVLRNMFDTVHIPLAAIEKVGVSRFLAVVAGERRYVSTAIGRSLAGVLGRHRAARRAATGGRSTPSYPDFVEQRLTWLAEDARNRAGVRVASDDQLALAAGVRRTWAWPELALLGLSFAVLVAGLFL